MLSTVKGEYVGVCFFKEEYAIRRMNVDVQSVLNDDTKSAKALTANAVHIATGMGGCEQKPINIETEVRSQSTVSLTEVLRSGREVSPAFLNSC